MNLALLFYRHRVDQATHAIRKQDINLSWFDHFSYFTQSKCWVHHCLTCSICTCTVVRRTCFSRTSICTSISSPRALERTTLSTLRTTHTRDLSALCYGDDYVTAHLITDNTKLLDTLTNCKYRLIHHYVSLSYSLRPFLMSDELTNSSDIKRSKRLTNEVHGCRRRHRRHRCSHHHHGFRRRRSRRDHHRRHDRHRHRLDRHRNRHHHDGHRHRDLHADALR